MNQVSGLTGLNLLPDQGHSQEHNLSLSGGFQNTTYYITGGLLDVQGIMISDDYKRVTNRINIDTKVNNWLTIGTRTQLSFDDASGIAPDKDSGSTRMNPLTRPYDEYGNLTIYPWPEDHLFRKSPSKYLSGTILINHIRL